MIDGVSDNDLSEVKQIKTKLYEAAYLDFITSSGVNIDDSELLKFFTQLFKIATGTERPEFLNEYERKNLSKAFTIPFPKEIQNLIDGLSVENKDKILQKIGMLRTTFEELDKKNVEANKFFQKPQSLPAIMVSASIILAYPPPPSTKPPAGLPFIKTLFYEIPHILKAQESYFDNGVRKPIMGILSRIQEGNAQPTTQDIINVLKEMTAEYRKFEDLLSEEIRNQKSKCEEIIQTIDFDPPEHKEILIKAFQENDIALIRKLTQDLPAVFQTYQCLLENRKATTEHHEGSVKELMTIFNKIKSQPLTEQYNELTLQLKQERNPERREEIHAELMKVWNMLAANVETRSFMYRIDKENTFATNSKKHNAQIITNLQQGAIPAMGSSTGLCFGYSCIFADQFNSLDPNASLEDMNQAFAGQKQFNTNFDDNHLAISLEAYKQYDAQYGYPLKDTFYFQQKSKPKEKSDIAENEVKLKSSLFITENVKRQLYCNDIIRFSSNNPCTYMLEIFPEDKGTGHALGFARNEKGIWLHDSNFGLIYFDSKNPNYENDFKAFLSDHIATRYPTLQGKLKISDIGVTHQLKKGAQALVEVVSNLKELIQVLNPDNTEESKIKTTEIDKIQRDIKLIFDNPKRKEAPKPEEIEALKANIEKLKQMVAVPDELKTNENISPLLQKCTESIAALEAQQKHMERMPLIKENPSVATAIKMNFSHISKSIAQVGKDAIANIKERRALAREIKQSSRDSKIEANVKDNHVSAENGPSPKRGVLFRHRSQSAPPLTPVTQNTLPDPNVSTTPERFKRKQ